VGRALLLIVLAAGGVLVPAAPARGPERPPARAAPIPLPPPGPMAMRRDRIGRGPRLDYGFAAQRSPSGRRIRVHLHGAGGARSRLLVAGCINGGRCPTQLRELVLVDCPPDDADLWFMPTLRPEGADLDRAPEHPGAAALRQAVADLRPQVTVLYRTGPRPVVRGWGAGAAAGRRYARVAGLPFVAARSPGLAGWIQAVRPRSAAITVELPAARLARLETMRHAFALQRLAGTRFTTPVHEGRSDGGTLSVLAGPGWHVASGGGVTASADLALASFRLPAATPAMPCAPAVVRRRLGRFGALILVHDRGDTRPGLAYPPRPRHLRLGAAGRAPCLGRAHVIRFSDAGRNVEVLAAFGREATRWDRERGREALDALRVER
jgi:hypothetical protein